MKNSLKKITGLLILLLFIAVTSVPLAQAQTSKKANRTDAELACENEKKEFDKAIEKTGSTEPQDISDYDSAFQEMQIAYHDYIGCMFQYAEGIILKSDGSDASNTISANTPNASALPFSGLVDWMSPDQACLDISEFKTVILKSEPNQLLGPMLETHASYKNHLRKLGDQFDKKAKATDSQGETLKGIEAMIAKEAFSSTVSRQRELEISSARLAIDLMFTSLKELRLSFVMHVNFQCTLQFLDKYRLSLEKMRKVIDSYPTKLENASVNP